MRSYKYFHAKLLLGLIVVAISVAFIERHYDFNKPNIILVTIPKSGSTYLLYSLQYNLNYKPMRLESEYDPETQSFKTNFPAFFKKNATIDRNHLRAPINLASGTGYQKVPVMDLDSLRLYTNKFVIHLRDPRQVLLSHLHQIAANPESIFVEREFRPTYIKMSLQEKIDWGIDNLFPGMIQWYIDWLTIKDLEDQKEDGLQILVTTYDEILASDAGIYKKILKFYGIKKIAKFAPPKKSIRTKYRKGDPTEYKSVYTAEQQRKIDALVPKSLLQRFKWDIQT